MTAASLVGAVVVNHDAGDALLACIASLRRAAIVDLVVVDNASSDGSLEALAAVDTAAVLLPTGRNLGYGRAVNRGVALLDNELVLVCNPDLVLEAGAPEALSRVLGSEGDVAVVGPLVVDTSGLSYPSARAFPSPVVAAMHALVGVFRPDNRWSRRYRMEDEASGERDADWVSGACFLVRRSAFEAVGGFDEGYFMYVEDLDLCWRLHRAGWRVRYVPEARVVHTQGVSARRHPYQMAVAHHRSTWRFARRTTTGWARILLPFLGAGLVARLTVSLAQLVSEPATRPLRPRADRDSVAVE